MMKKSIACLLFLAFVFMGCNKSLMEKPIMESESRVELQKYSVDYYVIMPSNEFWNLIDRSRENSLGDYENQQLALEKELLNLSPLEIVQFNNKYIELYDKANHWDVWAAAYIMIGGCSDTCFEDFRGWLIGQGETVFENAIANVESLSELSNVNDGNWDGLSSIPNNAHRQLTGEIIPVGIQRNYQIQGEEWPEEPEYLKNRFPELCERFY